MKFLRGLFRLLACILMPLLLLAFVVTLFSFTSSYSYLTNAATSGEGVTISMDIVFSFLSPLLKGSDIGANYTAAGALSDVTYSAESGVAFNFNITDNEFEFLKPSFAINTSVLIGAGAIIVGVFLLLCCNNKIGASLSALIIVAASIYLFTQDDAFSPFHFVIASSEEGSEPLINKSIDYLSTGITLIALMAISLIYALLSLTKKKKA